MNANDLTTIDPLCAFMSGTQRAVFEVAGDKQGRYDWVRRTVVKFDYSGCGKADRGVLISYLMKVSSYSRAQVKRLIKRYRETGRLTPRQRTVRGFTRRYTKGDIRLLAAMDERHNTPNGLTLKKLCERAYAVFGQAEYERLAGISVSHLYNLRQSQTCRRQRHTIEKTRPVTRDIGARRKPQSDGQPGTIRIDTVHQGDLDGEKGVYHINAVDEVTQFEVVVSVERISEVYLIPALAHLLASFPFVIRGFHADNGSEYINRRVARLLEKLRIEFTKSRARHSNDNALVECKNGHVVRKLLGHAHIPQRWAGLLNDFHRQHFNPYVNYHRPCLFPQTVTDKTGKQRKRYPYESLMTPYEKLKSIADAKTYLKPGLSFAILDDVAYRISDNAAADALQQARRTLFTTIYEQEQKRA